MKKYRNKEWLEKKYLKEKLSTTEIGEICGCSSVTIWHWLQKHGTRIRDAVPQGNHVDFTPYGLYFLDGLMLGDGGINNNPKSAQYYHGDTSQEYIEWLSLKLTKIGLENKIRPDGHLIQTKSYRELKSQYNQWYPTGHRKIRIPNRVEITPITLFNWFIGDGTYRLRKKRGQELFISSTGFEEGFSRIINQIKDLGITCTETQQRILILKESHEDFFDYILSSEVKIPPGYKYKFPDNQVEEFLEV